VILQEISIKIRCKNSVIKKKWFYQGKWSRL